MKILYLTPGVFDKGGIARYNRFQIRALREAYGSENVQVASLMGRQDDDLEEPFEVAFAGAMPLSKSSRALYCAEVLKLASRQRPDLVLSALVNLGPLAYTVAKIFRAGLAQNIYGYEIWTDSGLTLRRRAALKRSDFVVSDCHNTADRAKELGLVPRRPEVVWDCVDTERYCPGEPRWGALSRYELRRTDDFRILFLGRITRAARYKGYDRLLHLIARLSDRFTAILAGKGDDLPHVRALARDLGVEGRTTITGPIHEDDMPDVYRAADAFYLVSEVGDAMGEGIPLTPMEAMACGVPVLVGNKDGSRELLGEHGGWCGNPGDMDAQLAYLTALAEDQALHQKERQAARARATVAFGYQRFFAETTAAFNEAHALRRR